MAVASNNDDVVSDLGSRISGDDDRVEVVWYHKREARTCKYCGYQRTRNRRPPKPPRRAQETRFTIQHPQRRSCQLKRMKENHRW